MQTMVKTPTTYFFVKGTSEGLTKLNSFDRALLASGIGDTNLIRLSSIVPPNCRQIEAITLPGGSLVPVAYASLTSDRPGELISAAVAIGIPEDNTLPGLIMEYSAIADAETVEDFAKQMVLEGFRYRKRELKEMKSIAISTKVHSISTVFAGVVLWY